MNGVKRRVLPTKNESSGLVELVAALQKIDDSSPTAKLNETTISDNNGGRIVL